MLCTAWCLLLHATHIPTALRSADQHVSDDSPDPQGVQLGHADEVVPCDCHILNGRLVVFHIEAAGYSRQGDI